MGKKKKNRHKKGKTPQVHHQTYNTRNKTLLSIGYATYTDYLASELWSRIRVRAYAAHKGICRLCGEKGQDVHHLSYDRTTLLEGSLHNLVLLCQPCHRKVEFNDAGVKRNLREAQSNYKKLLRELEESRKPVLTTEEVIALKREKRRKRITRREQNRRDRNTRLLAEAEARWAAKKAATTTSF